LSKKEIGRLTFREFDELYRCYKEDFDLELQMTKRGLTYAELNSIESANHGMENTISW